MIAFKGEAKHSFIQSGSTQRQKLVSYSQHKIYVKCYFKYTIGFGRLTNKYFDEQLIWPDEKSFGIAIWKYRMQIRYQCHWSTIGMMEFPYRNTLCLTRKVIDKRTFYSILGRANKKWQKKVSKFLYDVLFFGLE